MSTWKDRLRELFELMDDRAKVVSIGNPQMRQEAVKFIADLVVPCFNEVATIAIEHGRDVEILEDINDIDTLPGALIEISKDEQREFAYQVKVFYSDNQLLCYPSAWNASQDKFVILSLGIQHHFIYSITREMILDSIVDSYYDLKA